MYRRQFIVLFLVNVAIVNLLLFEELKFGWFLALIGLLLLNIIVGMVLLFRGDKKT